MSRSTVALVMVGLSIAFAPRAAAEPGPEQAKAVAALRELGATVQTDDKAPGKPVVRVAMSGDKATNEAMEQVKLLTDLRTLEVIDGLVNDNGLAELKGLTKLRTLVIRDSLVTAEGLANLKGMTDLETLDLYNNNIADEGAENFSKLTSLRVLRLNRNRITDKTLEALKTLDKLEELNLRGTGVGNAGLEKLAGLKKLKVVDLGYRTRVNEAGVKAIEKAVPGLRVAGVLRAGEVIIDYVGEDD
jgi:hypothetical protein